MYAGLFAWAGYQGAIQMVLLFLMGYRLYDKMYMNTIQISAASSCLTLSYLERTSQTKENIITL
jgi:hypothetical protein